MRQSFGSPHRQATLARYQLVERLRGLGLTERHRALDPDGRSVVLHLLHPRIDSDLSRNVLWLANAEKAGTLTHHNIAQILDFGEADGRPYLVVEDLGGEDLATRLAALRERGERPARRFARQVVQDLAAALAYAHEHGVTHGDLRPENVVLTPGGAAVLTGFVITPSLRERTDRIAFDAGSPAYMAPEQGDGKPADARSDLYALGVIAYALLTGRLPYVGDPPLAVLLAHGHEPLPLPSRVDAHIGPTLERVLLRALAKDPADRYPDATRFAAALDEAMQLDARRAATAFVPIPRELREAAAAPVPSARWRTARSALLGAGAALAIAGVGLAILVTRPPSVGSTGVTTATAAPGTAAPLATSLPAATGPAPTAPPRTPQPLPTPAPATPAPSGPRLGVLLYEAKLDGTVELDRVRVFSGGAADARVSFERGAIELAVNDAPGGAIAFFHIPARTSYAGLFTVSVPRTSEVLFTWALRRDGDASYLLRLDARTETLSLVYDDGVRWREALAPQVRVRDLRSGRAVPIAFSVAGPDLAVYVDGRLVMEARDARIQRATLPPDVFVGEEGGIGAIRIASARLYAAP